MPGHEPVFLAYSHLRDFPRADEALRTLRNVARLVRPLMRARHWKVHELAEFYPDQASLLGLNLDRGHTIFLRLRHPADPTRFLSPEQVGDTLLHELAHIVRGPHDEPFHALWNQLRDEHWALMLKRSTGTGQQLQQQRPRSSSRRRAGVAGAASSGRRPHPQPHPHPHPGQLPIGLLAVLRGRTHPAPPFPFPFAPPFQAFHPGHPEPHTPLPFQQVCLPHRSRHDGIRPLYPDLHQRGRRHGDRHRQKQVPAQTQQQQKMASSCATASLSDSDQTRAAAAAARAQAAARRGVLHTTDATKDVDDIASDEAIAQALWEEGLALEEVVSERQRQQMKKAEAAAEAGRQRWTCGACTLHNPAVYLCCGACGLERGAASPGSKSKSRSRSKSRSKPQKVRFAPSTGAGGERGRRGNNSLVT